MDIKSGVSYPAMCSICGELFENGNATTAIGIIENGTVTKLYCLDCFIEDVTTQVPDKVREIINKVLGQ
jgi:hypothetical protein